MDQISEERQRIRHKAAYKKALVGTVDVLLIAAAIAVLISTLFLPVLQITGSSMEPCLCSGNIIVMVKTDKLKTGDVCSFTWNNRTLVKRVIGNAGDWIEIDRDGTVFVNGEALEEPYVMEKSLGECDLTFPYQVPEDSVFLMGDHRDSSIDSRSSVIGSVGYDQLVGKVLFRVWPLKEIGPVH
jgi:signal peptidase I